MKNLSKTISCFILWSFSTLFSFYMVFVLRDFFLIAMETLSWGEYTINLIDKLLILIIGLATVVFFLYIQHVYQHKGCFIFFIVTSMQMLLYGTINFSKLLIINLQVPILQTIDYLILLCIFSLSILSFYCYRLFKRR